MGWITDFFASNGALHQVIRTGSTVTDLTTNQTVFVVSESNDSALVFDDRGDLHNLLRSGSMTTDLTTGQTYFEV